MENCTIICTECKKAKPCNVFYHTIYRLLRCVDCRRKVKAKRMKKRGISQEVWDGGLMSAIDAWIFSYMPLAAGYYDPDEYMGIWIARHSSN